MSVETIKRRPEIISPTLEQLTENNCQAVWGQWLSQLNPSLVRISEMIVGNHEVAEDVVMGYWEEFYKKIKENKLKNDKSLNSYVRHGVKLRSLSELRKTRRNGVKRDSSLDEITDFGCLADSYADARVNVEDEVVTRVRTGEIKRRIGEILGNEGEQIVVLSRIAGLENFEIAEDLVIRPGAVRKRQHRGIKDIKEETRKIFDNSELDYYAHERQVPRQTRRRVSSK